MRVIVVGAGFAGLTTAIRLQERRHDVVLLERRGVLGGRATSVRDAVTGDAVDNGTHLILGGYVSTLDLLRHAGAAELVDVRDALRVDYVDDRGRSTLACPPVPAPLHLFFGLLGLRLPWRVRWEAVRFGLSLRFRARPVGLSVAELLVRTGQSAVTRRLLWDPLATAIANATPESADAGSFVQAFREALLLRASYSAQVFPRVGFGEVVAQLAQYFEGRGGVIRRGARVSGLEVEAGRVRGVALAYDERLEADVVVLAVPWNAVEELVPEPWRTSPPFVGLTALGVSPIVAVEMWVDRQVLEGTMVGLRDEEAEWVFDKGRLLGREGPPQYLSFIVSAASRASGRPNEELVASALKALRRYFRAARDATVVRSLVRREAEATFVNSPEHERLRPGAVTPIGGLFLAGDWTSTGLPATIEGAVRSGDWAAAAVDGRTGKGQRNG